MLAASRQGTHLPVTALLLVRQPPCGVSRRGSSLAGESRQDGVTSAKACLGPEKQWAGSAGRCEGGGSGRGGGGRSVVTSRGGAVQLAPG